MGLEHDWPMWVHCSSVATPPVSPIGGRLPLLLPAPLPASSSCRGLYFTLFREKPLEKKLIFLADFIKKLGPFYKKLNFDTLYRPRPKAKKSENAPNNQMQSHIKDLYSNSFIVPHLLK